MAGDDGRLTPKVLAEAFKKLEAQRPDPAQLILTKEQRRILARMGAGYYDAKALIRKAVAVGDWRTAELAVKKMMELEAGGF